MRRSILLFVSVVTFFAVSAMTASAQDSALLEAAEDLDVVGAKKAIANGADVNAAVYKSKNPMTALDSMWSGIYKYRDEPEVEKRSIAFAKVLFDHGAKFTRNNRLVLFASIAEGHTDLTKFLVSKGAPVDVRIGLINGGWTPAELAIKYGKPDIYDALMAAGAESVPDDEALQIRYVQAASGADLEQFLAVKSDGASANRADTSGTTPLIAAIDMPIYLPAKESIIRMLLADGADANTNVMAGESTLSKSPLHRFVSMNKLTMSDESDEVRNRAERVMRMLLKAGAKVSSRDKFDATPLHIAAASDNLRAAEILIEEGAKVMAKDFEGKTPLDYAESGPMIKLLKAHGATE
jgi:ankyrin repeat protein